MEFLIGMFSFLTVALPITAMWLRREEKEKELIAIVEGVEEQVTTLTWMDRVGARISKLLPLTRAGQSKVETNLRHAGRPYSWDANVVLVIRIILLIVLLAISTLTDSSTGGHIFVGLVFALIGYLGPDMLIYSYKSMRQANIRKQTRQFTMMFSLLQSTGIRTDQALYEAIQSTTGSFRDILDTMIKKIDFRYTLTEGFAWLVEETGVKEIERLYVVIEQSERNGTELNDALAAMIREADQELENKVERLSQSVSLKVTLTVLGLIIGPVVVFDLVIAGINFVNSFGSI